MSLCVVTVNNPSPAMDKQAGEVALIARALDLAAHHIRAHGGTVTSGTMYGDGATVLGTWVYTPVATS